MKSSPYIFTPCLPHHSHPIHWDRTTVLVCRCLGQDQHRCKSFSILCPISLKQSLTVCLFNHFHCYIEKTSEDTSLWRGLSLIDTSMSDGQLNCFIHFAIEHQLGCCSTEPCFAGILPRLKFDWFNWLIDNPFQTIIDLTEDYFGVQITEVRWHNTPLSDSSLDAEPDGCSLRQTDCSELFSADCSYRSHILVINSDVCEHLEELSVSNFIEGFLAIKKDQVTIILIWTRPLS